jgi:hypothetical protein
VEVAEEAVVDTSWLVCGDVLCWDWEVSVGVLLGLGVEKFCAEVGVDTSGVLCVDAPNEVAVEGAEEVVADVLV